MVIKSVLLIKNIQNLGNIGDIIKVKGGYVRNFLLPNNFAIIISRKNAHYIRHKKNLMLRKNIKEQQDIKTISEKIKSIELIIHADIANNGKLFGSIKSKDISRHLKYHDLDIDYKKIIISNPIKYIGSHQVKIINK
jgi:large subunit ribosomal protein L9